MLIVGTDWGTQENHKKNNRDLSGNTLRTPKSKMFPVPHLPNSKKLKSSLFQVSKMAVLVHLCCCCCPLLCGNSLEFELGLLDSGSHTFLTMSIFYNFVSLCKRIMW